MSGLPGFLKGHHEASSLGASEIHLGLPSLVRCLRGNGWLATFQADGAFHGIALRPLRYPEYRLSELPVHHTALLIVPNHRRGTAGGRSR